MDDYSPRLCNQQRPRTEGAGGRHSAMQQDARLQVSKLQKAVGRGAGAASGHKAQKSVDGCPRRQSLSASNGLSSLLAPSRSKRPIRFIHLVTHRRPDQQAESPKMRGALTRGRREAGPKGLDVGAAVGF